MNSIATPPQKVARPERRRAALAMQFFPRTLRGARHMRKDLAYMLRYADMANFTPDGRARFQRAVDWARESLAARLSSFPSEWQAHYETAAGVDEINYNAQHRCIVVFIELIRIADKIYFSLEHKDAFSTLGKRTALQMRADIYRILRNVTVQSGGGEPDERIQ